jgi:hypothetical protein
MTGVIAADAGDHRAQVARLAAQRHLADVAKIQPDRKRQCHQQNQNEEGQQHTVRSGGGRERIFHVGHSGLGGLIVMPVIPMVDIRHNKGQEISRILPPTLSPHMDKPNYRDRGVFTE